MESAQQSTVPISAVGRIVAVLSIVGGHFIHDIYPAFLAPLLPVLMQQLSISLTMAGSLSAILQLPGLLNPFIGYLADRVNVRYFVIVAPALTGTLMSAMGFAPSYLSLAVLLFVTGISVAMFHAPAPAMVTAVSGRYVGTGMSMFMAGGELGRTVGPLLAVWGVTALGLDGIFLLAALGWLASLVLFWRLRSVSARPAKRASLFTLVPELRRLFLPLSIFTMSRSFLVAAVSVYLPTYMEDRTGSLWLAGSALAILQAAGVAGALVSGTLSDWLGRRQVLLAASITSVGAMAFFLNASSWQTILALVVLGFASLSTMPVLLAIVQENTPQHRSTANGLFMSITFVLNTIAILAIGAVGERYGLATAYWGSAAIVLVGIPIIFLLPRRLRSS